MKSGRWYKILQLILLIMVYLTSDLRGQDLEVSSIACADGIDNDADGRVDCEDPACAGLGCTICEVGASFADLVLAYEPGCTALDLNRPEAALGLADWSIPRDGHAVALGEGGTLTLGFENNLLSNSGDSLPDLWIFEVGERVEPCSIALRPFNDATDQKLKSFGLNCDPDGFYPVGSIEQDRKWIDIDFISPGLVARQLHFDAVRIQDVPDLECSATINPGADIDAICALTSVDKDCRDQPGGDYQLDRCGRCLSMSDPAFDSCDYDLYIPEAFSPNGDGVNDIFRAYTGNAEGLQVVSLQIFDRWGALIFVRQNFAFDQDTAWWDGTIGDAVGTTGVYYYRLRIKFSEGTEFVKQGMIHLLY